MNEADVTSVSMESTVWHLTGAHFTSAKDKSIWIASHQLLLITHPSVLNFNPVCGTDAYSKNSKYQLCEQSHLADYLF